MLDDTLVIWGWRVRSHQLFTRQTHRGQLQARPSSALFHHVDGWRRRETRTVYGETDDFSYNITSGVASTFTISHATMLRLLGIDHERLTYFYQAAASA